MHEKRWDGFNVGTQVTILGEAPTITAEYDWLMWNSLPLGVSP